MKYAFISDIHGNAVALEAVLADIKKQGIDKVYVLGDLCFRGPEPKKCLNIIRSSDMEVIKGNADEWIIRGIKRGEVSNDVLDAMNIERDWTISHLEPTDIAYLESLSHGYRFKVEDVSIRAFHATPSSLFEVVLPNEKDEDIYEKMMAGNAQLFVYGHIHIPFIRYINGKTLINTGSVGLPFDGLAKASYAVVEIESGRLRTTIERVDFDIDRVIELYHEKDYPNKEAVISLIKNNHKN